MKECICNMKLAPKNASLSLSLVTCLIIHGSNSNKITYLSRVFNANI